MSCTESECAHAIHYCCNTDRYCSALQNNLAHEHLDSEVRVDDFYAIHGDQELGKGTYGRVLVATHRGTAKRYACKVINVTRMEPRQVHKKLQLQLQMIELY
jgi:hypothetical protein